jgi:hypothetical protein
MAKSVFMLMLIQVRGGPATKFVLKEQLVSPFEFLTIRYVDFEALRTALLQAINRFNHLTVSSLLITQHLGATTKVDQ